MENGAGILIKRAIKILVAGIVAAILLSIFCIGYLNTGVHIENKTGATDYKWREKQFKSTMVEGFAWIKMDEQGFNNDFHGNGNVDILLMGSSHMEAYNVASDKNTGYLLNVILPEYYTYNIGVSGHTIYSCANNIRAAVKEYNPNEFIVIETDRIDLDVGDMQRVVSEKYPHIKSYDNGLLFLIQQYFPLARNVYKQLADWWSADTSMNKQVEDSESQLDDQEGKIGIKVEDEYEASLNQFLSYIRTGGGGLQHYYCLSIPNCFKPGRNIEKTM